MHGEIVMRFDGINGFWGIGKIKYIHPSPGHKILNIIKLNNNMVIKRKLIKLPIH